MLKIKIVVNSIVLVALLAIAFLNVTVHGASDGVAHVTVRLSSDTVARGDDVTIFALVKDYGGSPIGGMTATAAIGDLEVIFLLSEGDAGSYQVTIGTSILNEGIYEIVVTVEKEGFEPVQTSRTLTVTQCSRTTDLNYDGGVNIVDMTLAAKAFGTVQGDSRWSREADINGDGEINIVDLTRIAKDFGKTIVPQDTDTIKFKANVNGMREVDVLVRVDTDDGLTQEEAEQIAEATFTKIMGEEVLHQLDILTFDDTEVEAHYTWGLDENDMGHVFDMVADLTALVITVDHCF
jgi:hypothetical protein